MKDLRNDNRVHLDKAVRVDYAKPKQSQFTQTGDIIFGSRGQTNTAAIFDAEAGDTIVAAPLLHLRPNTKKVLPEFLLWWINQPSSQNYIKSRSQGTMVKMVTKESLENLEITLPPLKQQYDIAELFRLSMKEQSLFEKIKERKARYTQGILMQIARNQHSDTKNHGRDGRIRAGNSYGNDPHPPKDRK